jgi:riboflavin kinase/FMN adenylyltransferase
MKIVKGLEEIQQPFKNAVITIGNFDGVHIGHQALLHAVTEKAAAIEGTSIVMTFDPHPITLLQPDNQPPLITLNEQKSELISRTGIDILICVPFTKSFSKIGAHEFVHHLLIQRIGMKAIVVGKDYTFGRDREGDVALLKKW